MLGQGTRRYAPTTDTYAPTFGARIARTRNPTRARTPINRKRLVNKAEATAAATGKPFIMIRQYWISVTTPTLQYYTITHYDLPLMTFTNAHAHFNETNDKDGGQLSPRISIRETRAYPYQRGECDK